jgi:NAD+ synthase
LRLDPELETQRITSWIRQTVFHTLRRKGAVIAVSGGIDSSVVAFLCARALGHDRIQLLFMPEADSSPNSLQLGRMVADRLNVKSVLEDISPILTGAGC